MGKMAQSVTMGMGKQQIQKPKDQRKIAKVWLVGDVEVLNMGGGNAQHLDKAIISLSNQPI